MTWVKLDDRYATHRKMLAAGTAAIALDVAGMCYAAGHDTDGHIPTVALTAAAPFLTRGQAITAAGRLVEAGRWKPVKDGWQIHDYLTYNPSSAERDNRRKQAVERTGRWRGKRRGGDASQDDERRGGDASTVRPDARTRDATPLRGLEKPKEQASLTPPPRDPSPDPPDTPPPSVAAAADDDVPEHPKPQPSGNDRPPPPKLSAQLRAEHAAKTLADHGIANGQPPPPATRDDVDPADFEAERRRQLAALKASESETP